MEPPPLTAEQIVVAMQGRADPGKLATEAHEQMGPWARKNLAEPILEFLGTVPSVVLWSPDHIFRLIPPSAVWRDIPVATAVGLGVPALRSGHGRHRSTLVAMADPGDRSTGAQSALGAHGMDALSMLRRTAQARGDVRVLASVGSQYGKRVLPETDDVIDAPASAAVLVEEFRNHDVVVLVAHGQVGRESRASITCMAQDGRLDALDIDALEAHPDCLAGATVLLLSCESGRVGGELARPGGIAGTLIAAGVRCVVGPMWPVRLDAAAEVVAAILSGMAEGSEPWKTLATLTKSEASGTSPLLGPAPSVSAQRAHRVAQQLAFVTWVG
jgi:hypothetical protein